MKSLIRKSLPLLITLTPFLTQAVVVGPYTPDANTLHLYHFDEIAGGTVTANAGSIGGNAYSVTEATASATPATVTTVLGASSFSGFGNAVTFPTAGYLIGFDANASGAFQGDVSSSTLSADRINMNTLNMGNGGQTPWTIEAIIAPTATNAAVNQEIVCTDSSSGTRAFQFKITTAGQLQFQTINNPTFNLAVAIPSSGPHGFISGNWYHVAATYDGTTVRLYWTALNSGAIQANQIGSSAAAIGSSFGTVQGPLTIGNENRAAAGETFGGKIDEVRISKIARAANGMMFANGVTIVANPNNAVVAPGATAGFTVTATTDFGPLSYQWRTNSVPVPDGGDFSGATTATLHVANAQDAYAALTYDCVVTDSRVPVDSATSASATLLVRTPLSLSWLAAPADYNWNSTSINWLDTDHATNAAFTIGDNVTFDDNGGNASPVSLIGTLAPTSVTFNNSSVAYTVISGDGRISGGTGLTKSNNGTVALLTPTNDYAGITTLNGGVLSVTNISNGGSPSPIGAASSDPANLVLNGGTLQYTGASASTDRGATLGANGGTVEVTTGANSLTVGGVIAGTSGGGLKKAGPGTLVLTGANTYDGVTVVSAGTLRLSGNGTFGAGNVTNNSALLFSGSRTVANAIAGTGSLTNDATGTLTLSGVSSYSGQTVINGPLNGGLVVANSSALGNSPLVTVISTTGGAVGGTRVTLNSGVAVPPINGLLLPCAGNTVRSTLYAAGASSWNGPITLVGDNSASPNDQLAFAGSGGALTIGGNITGVNFPGTLQLRGDGNNGGVGGSILGTISLAGNATVQVNDGVTWTIASTGNAWGISEIARGTLQLGQNNALPIGTSVKMGAAGNANLDLAGFTQQIAALTNVANVDVIGNSSTTSDSTLVYSTNNATSTFGGSIVDTLGAGTRKTALTVAGGTLALTASNAYSGPTTISSGTLALGASGSINSSTAISIAAGGTLDVSAIASYNLSANTSLSASGTGTSLGSTAAAINGGTSVNLGSQPITLAYDGSHPALLIAQGTLSLNGNAITVNGSPLAAGVHILVHQANGSINAGSFPLATGTAIAAGTTNFISVNGGDLVLNVLNISSTTLARTIGTSPSTYGSPLRFHAVVTPAPADGETISFFSDATLIGTATTTGGAADLDIANLPASVSVQNITASYPGDSLNTPSTGTLAGGQLVNPATLVPSVSIASKTYDGTTAATINGRSLAGIVGTDNVNLDSSGAATFASANVGTAVSVNVSGLGLSGTAAANYVLSSSSLTTNADITAATLTYVADHFLRSYGDANPSFTGTVIGFVSGEDQSSATTGTLTFTSSATSASAPGSYAINGGGLTANNGNYTFAQAVGNPKALTIAQATLTPVVTVSNKVYDGTAAATVATRSLLGIVGSDDVSLDTNDVAFFASTNVGTAISVTITNLSLTGSVASNYVLSATTFTTNADITPATLTYVADPVSRVYGAANPAFTGSVTGFVNGEDQASATTGTLSFDSSATASSSPGSYSINGSGLTANFGNYVFVQAAGNATALTINAATLTPSVVIANKIYDGTTAATITARSLAGIIGSDDVNLDTSGTAVFASANVGAGLPVNVSSLDLSGTSAGNYVLSTTSLTTNADITPATLTYVADPTNRVYGAANPAFTGTVIGFVNGENQATATTGTLSFDSPATATSVAGSYPIDGSGLVANFGNYVFAQAAGNATALTITVNTSPVSLTLQRLSNSVVWSPNSVLVSWPSDHLGWRLQVQTNSFISGSWSDVAGSTLTNQVVVTPDARSGAYRLVSP